MTGRMLTVKISTSYGILTMCELEIYGEPAAPSPSFSAVVMGRRGADVQKKLCWSEALLYCREHYWDLLSVRSEQEQRGLEAVLKTQPSWQTIASSVASGHVWLGLRRCLMGSSWLWMSGASLSYIYWKEQQIWQVTSPCGGMDADDSFYWRNFLCGEHFYFVCLKEFEENGKRVEFYSFTRQTRLHLQFFFFCEAVDVSWKRHRSPPRGGSGAPTGAASVQRASQAAAAFRQVPATRLDSLSPFPRMHPPLRP
ncbi:macrophage mannose receptor 1-like [Gambusia affinis]|uniref:macrophage mannose receptor 1-like n=1 Tax=Gambusia affinis TaxID=33528 RepID=UPI001CDC438D|nr:macrophage mannose receptor 1-like [Gambusia affinis]